MQKVYCYYSGLSLVEILISLVLLSGTLLGLLSASTTALKHVQTAYYNSIASQITRNYVMQFRLSPQLSFIDVEALLPNGSYQLNQQGNQAAIDMSWETSQSTQTISTYFPNIRA